MLPVSLEISGKDPSLASSIGDHNDVSFQKQESSSGAIRLLVAMPTFVNAEQANHAAALLFEQIDQLPSESVVERVKMNGLRFTVDGVHSIREFLANYAPTVKHLSLKNILSSPNDEAIFTELATAFQRSELEILNLSDNYLGKNTWKHWASQIKLRQLLLDQVEMDDASIGELACQFTYGETLEDIYVVSSKSVGTMAVGDACSILEGCTNLTSVRWANRTNDSESKLPWSGLRQLVSNQVTGSGVASLRHLVMDGATITVSELGNDGLSGALKGLTQLETLKLRRIGLRDGGVRSVVGALQISQPPLVWLDLSGNNIEGGGAIAIAQLVHVDAIISNIKALVLEQNDIDTEGGSEIVEAFASQVSLDGFDIRLDENPINFSKIAMGMAWARVRAERERDEALKDRERMSTSPAPSLGYEKNMRTLLARQSSTLAELKVMNAEIESLKQERDVLAKALRMVGVNNEVEEQDELLHRVSTLEEMVRKSLPMLLAKKVEAEAPSRSLRRRRPSLGSLSSMLDSSDEFQDSIATPPDVSTPSSSGHRLSPSSPNSGERGKMQKQNSIRIKYVQGQSTRSLRPGEPSTPRKFRNDTPNAADLHTPKKVIRVGGRKVRRTSSLDNSPIKLTSPTGIVSPPARRGNNNPRIYRATSEKWGLSPQKKESMDSKPKAIDSRSLSRERPRNRAEYESS